VYRRRFRKARDFQKGFRYCALGERRGYLGRQEDPFRKVPEIAPGDRRVAQHDGNGLEWRRRFRKFGRENLIRIRSKIDSTWKNFNRLKLEVPSTYTLPPGSTSGNSALNAITRSTFAGNPRSMQNNRRRRRKKE
jgi:hypothetical protein